MAPPPPDGTRANYGLLLTSLGRLDAAERLLCEALDVERAVSGARHPVVASRLSQLAYVALDRGDFAETELLLVEASSILEEAAPDGLRRSLGYRFRASDAARRAGRVAEAAARFEALAAESVQRLGPDANRVREALPLLRAARDSLAAEPLATDPDLRYEFGVAERALAAVSRRR